ncbi:AAA family ATPase [Paucisalibacillus globulus]|uniref:AAA family ATPase n=1 Tax=Paucisalibacillus globulus TaxID=351095 RepID=UPI000BB8A364|nr:AAA family ATPase [Paucisalibacillus globulus]
MFFLQMSGFPGSGKSTLAREIAKQTGAVLVDHDVVKSALLEEVSNIDRKEAGIFSYNIDWAIVESNLSIGHSVILDSPCLYDVMIEKGEYLVEKYKAKYKYIECVLEDFQEVNKRLKNREKMASQISEIKSKEAFQLTLKSSKRPNKHATLIIDTSQHPDTYLSKVMDYINE